MKYSNIFAALAFVAALSLSSCGGKGMDKQVDKAIALVCEMGEMQKEMQKEITANPDKAEEIQEKYKKKAEKFQKEMKELEEAFKEKEKELSEEEQKEYQKKMEEGVKKCMAK